MDKSVLKKGISGQFSVSFVQLKKLSVPEIEAYCRQKRQEDFDKGKKLSHIRLRRVLHPVFYRLLKVDRWMKHESIKVIRDDHKPPQEAAAYAVTHIGGNDIERAFEIIREHAYIMMGTWGSCMST